jgi:RHS repeat-associated protein
VDNAGNRTAKTDQRAAVTSNYGYDAIYELTGVTQGANTTESYTYDPVGNRLSSLGLSPYSINVSNQLTSTPSTSYTYDHNGNTLTSVTGSNTTTYAWDFESRLTSVTLPGTGGTVNFKYDPFGRRIYKSSSSGISLYAYDGDNLIEETDATGAVVARYSDGFNIDEPLAMLRGGATSYYHADGLGSITSLSGPAGALAQTYTFDSFGKQTASSGSLTNPFRYAARESDAETGLYYYRARYYDPSTGRFLSEDPIRYAGHAIDFYRYSLNNPANLIDPTGLATVVNNTGAPIIVSGNPGQGHGTGGQVYGVVPPDGNVYGGAQNPIAGYPTIQAAIDAYNGAGPIQTVGNVYDIDFYSPTPLTKDAKASDFACTRKIVGDDEGPNFHLKKDKNGNIVDSLDSWWQWLKAASRRIFG